MLLNVLKSKQYLDLEKITLLSWQFVFFFFMAGCTSEHKSAGPEEKGLKSLELTEDLSISLMRDDLQASHFSGLAVHESGDIYVSDLELQKIHRFSGDGEHLGTLGRAGQGPGEFDNFNPNISICDDTLYVLDPRAYHVQLFDLSDQSYLETVSPEYGAAEDPQARDDLDAPQPEAVMPMPDGSLLISWFSPYFMPPDEDAKPHPITVTQIDKSGDVKDDAVVVKPRPYPANQRLISYDEQRMEFFSVPFYPDIRMRTGRDGHLYIGTTDTLEIRKLEIGGEQIQSIGGTLRPKSVTDADLDSIAESKATAIPEQQRDGNRMREVRKRYIEVVQEAGLPDQWPVFRDFLIDDNERAWVQLIRPGDSESTWWIFNEEGQPGWQFRLPEEVTLYEIKEESAYGIKETDGGELYIVRYSPDDNILSK